MAEKQLRARFVTNTVHEPVAGQLTSIRHSDSFAAAEGKTPVEILDLHGKICVLGTASDGTVTQPAEVRARVFRAEALSGLTDTPPSDAIVGVVEDLTQPIPHNYRFLHTEAGGSKAVPDARDNHTHADPDNHLVVWTRFGEDWTKSAVVQFVGNGEPNKTECERARPKT
jgi:hypothetical protein